MKTEDLKIKAILRKLWFFSRERYEALKKSKYTCEKCGNKKKDGHKLNVHHNKEINWAAIYKVIRKELLHEDLQVLCLECHLKKHAKRSK